MPKRPPLAMLSRARPSKTAPFSAASASSRESSWHPAGCPLGFGYRMLLKKSEVDVSTVCVYKLYMCIGLLLYCYIYNM